MNPESDPSTLPTPVHSFGQKAVGISFNPSENTEVRKFKEVIAIAIDAMNDLRSESKSAETKRICSVAITELQTAQMWGVKALTWQD